MATAPATTRQKTPATLTCPECGRTFTRPAALGAHRRMTHGVAGTSANATNQRSKKRTRKPSMTASNGRLAPRRARTVATNDAQSVDRDALLGALFPAGIPPRQDVIGAVNAWLEEAERLSRVR